jgi:hypothetical protein
MIKPKFSIGQPVIAVSFTDCFGKLIPERTGLIVESIRLIECVSIRPYFRIKAVTPDGLGMVEGAERFFTAA